MDRLPNNVLKAIGKETDRAGLIAASSTCKILHGVFAAMVWKRVVIGGEEGNVPRKMVSRFANELITGRLNSAKKLIRHLVVRCGGQELTNGSSVDSLVNMVSPNFFRLRVLEIDSDCGMAVSLAMGQFETMGNIELVARVAGDPDPLPGLLADSFVCQQLRQLTLQLDGIESTLASQLPSSLERVNLQTNSPVPVNTATLKRFLSAAKCLRVLHLRNIYVENPKEDRVEWVPEMVEDLAVDGEVSDRALAKLRLKSAESRHQWVFRGVMNRPVTRVYYKGDSLPELSVLQGVTHLRLKQCIAKTPNSFPLSLRVLEVDNGEIEVNWSLVPNLEVLIVPNLKLQSPPPVHIKVYKTDRGPIPAKAIF